jgi:hypothetical protein
MPVLFVFSREKTLPHVARVAMLIPIKMTSERPSSYPARLSGGPFFLASAENLRRLTKLSVRQGLFVKRLLIGSLADTERPASFIRLKIGFNGSRGLEAPPTGAVKAPVSCCSGLLRTPIS